MKVEMLGRVAIACLATVVLSAAQAQDAEAGREPAPTLTPDPVSIDKFLVFKERAFIIGDPILVSGPLVTGAFWSPNGQFAIIDRWTKPFNVLDIQAATKNKSAETPIHFLSLYSLATGRISDVAKLPWEEQADAQTSWIQGSSIALVSVTRAVLDAQGKVHQDAALYWLNADTGEYKELRPWSLPGSPESIEVVPSPATSFAFLKARFPGEVVKLATGRERQGLGRLELMMISAEGRIGEVPLDPGLREVVPAWSSSGEKGYLLAAPQAGRRTWLTVTPRILRPAPIERPLDLWMGERPVGLITVRDVPSSSVNGRFSASLHPLWLETVDPDSQSRVLLSGDGEDPQVNATLDAASFIAQGSFYVRPITEISRSRYDAALLAYRRSEALKKVREVGLAAIMFASDNDDVYPGANPRILDLLSPYLRDMDSMNGFNYTFPGGPAANIANPSATELGYIQFDDGRAVVYADGHARWVPNPKK